MKHNVLPLMLPARSTAHRRRNGHKFDGEGDFEKWVLAGEQIGVDFDGWIYWFE